MRAMTFAAALILAAGATAQAASPPPPGAASCSGCHALHQAASPSIPGIYGRDADEVSGAMIAFRDGSRPATVMNRIAKGFSEDELRAIAAWLSEQK